MTVVLETERLLLRHWTPADRAAFHAMNADPLVMRHFPKRLTQTEADEKLARMEAYQRDHGFTFWAVERKADGELIGNCGLKPLTVPWPEPTDIEIGWMFRAPFHGRGYAREAARATLAHGLTLAPRVIAMTVPANRESWGLMVRLGMQRAAHLDFNHPDLPGSPLERHIIYVKEAA